MASGAAAQRAAASLARQPDAPPAEPASGQAPAAEALLSLQRGAGNAAVSRYLAQSAASRPPGRSLARAESLVKQGALAIAGGGFSVSAAAFLNQGAAWRNALEHVSDKDSQGRNLGVHLGPCDALRHCTWSALVMMAALVDQSPENRALDSVLHLGLPQPPPLIDFVSMSPELGTHLFPTARERARAVLMSHEIAGSGTKTADSKMDQENNEVGMTIAEELFGQRKRTEEAICQAARVALDTGRLKMFNIDGNLIPTAGWRDLNPDTWLGNVYLDVFAKPTDKQPRPRTRAERDKSAAPPAPVP